MKKNNVALLSLSLALLCKLTACGGGGTEPAPGETCDPIIDDNKVHLVILAGQSGARGKAVNKDLTDEEKVPNANVDIIADGLTMPELVKIPETISSNATLQPVKPGFGDSTTEFGPELGLAETMASRYQKDGESRKSVIVKYSACGSTFTNDWYSTSALDDSSINSKIDTKQVRVNPVTNKRTGPLTNNLYQLIDKAKSDIESEGYETVVDGVVFIHGEQDAKFDDNMEIYEKALKHFINDMREYLKDENVPFVISEAGTNSAKYSNKLREIQRRVSENDKNSIFVETSDLKTNTFEPWHFGKEGNYILGNRIASELIKENDTRVVESYEECSISVAKGEKIALPKYQVANFTNGTKGYVKVDEYSDYDANKVGIQEVEYKTKINCEESKGKVTLNIGNYANIDGKVTEKTYGKENKIEDKVKVKFVKANNGIYVGANVTDNSIYSDGEAWRIGDMGQKNQNSDLRIYITDSDAASRYTVALSSANLLRVYNSGISLMKDSDAILAKNNLIFNKEALHFDHKVVINGEPNGGTCTGMDMEVFIPYEDLGYDETSELKVLVEYSGITKNESGSKVASRHFMKNASAVKDNFEEDDASYISLEELI